MQHIATFSRTLESYPSDMTDAELVQQILNGNSNAFRYLVSKNRQLVVHIVGRMVRKQEDVEDLCQEVFIKVYRNIRKFRGDSRLSTWIASIAYNAGISFLRKQNRQNEVSLNDLTAAEADQDSGFTAAGIENKEVKEYMLKLIEKLPVQYRTVLTLFHLEEFSYKEIEQITAMPEGTIKSYLSRARKLLKDKMEQLVYNEKTNIFTGYVRQE